MSRFSDFGSGRRSSVVLKELENHYASFNTSGEGLTLEQTRQALAALQASMTTEKLLDIIRRVNDDSSLWIEDILVDFHLFTHLLSQHMIPMDHERMLREAFNVFDHGAEGVISAQELTSVMRTMGHGPRTEQEIQEMFQQMQVCPARGISFDQMKKLLVLDKSKASSRATSRAKVKPSSKRSPSAVAGSSSVSERSTTSSRPHSERSTLLGSQSDVQSVDSVSASSSNAVSLVTMVDGPSIVRSETEEAIVSEFSGSVSRPTLRDSSPSVRTDTTEL